MGRVHNVQPGECLSRIARDHGFASYETIYDHPENAELRRKRPDPNLIHPGDRVFIPPREEKQEPCGTGASHRFKVRRMRRTLKIRLLQHDGRPMENAAYALRVGGESVEGQTDPDGVLQAEIPLNAHQATLRIAGRVWTVAIGHLNPMDEVGDDASGVQGRLRNLGYDVGAIDGALGPRTRAAIRAFQERNSLAVDGECTPALIAKLKEIHGC